MQAFDKQVTQSVYNDNIKPDILLGRATEDPPQAQVHGHSGDLPHGPSCSPNCQQCQVEAGAAQAVPHDHYVQGAACRKTQERTHQDQDGDDGSLRKQPGHDVSPGKRYRRSRSRREHDFGGSHCEYERPTRNGRQH